MDYRKAFFVDGKVKLKDRDASATPGCESKEAAALAFEPIRQRLAHQHNLLYAEKRRSLLIVLQGLDASGKDGVIGKAFASFNPQGVIVTSFKEPTSTELSHDFLWRVHQQAPARGAIAIFNRSHYEDVLITRVHKKIDDKTTKERFAHIRDFETLLAENGAAVLKFFLHISKDEQLSRFEKRLVDPERNWKVSESDYSERLLWDHYMEAYEDALNATSTTRAPWYVIPADRKWFRDLAISQIVAEALEGLDMRFPKPTVDLADIRLKYHAAAEEAKAEKAARADK